MITTVVMFDMTDITRCCEPSVHLIHEHNHTNRLVKVVKDRNWEMGVEELCGLVIGW